MSISACVACITLPWPILPWDSGATNLRQLDLALVQSSGLGGCVASGVEAVTCTHEDHIWFLYWFQHTSCQLIAHLVAQGATIGVHLARTGKIRGGQPSLSSCILSSSPSLCPSEAHRVPGMEGS